MLPITAFFCLYPAPVDIQRPGAVLQYIRYYGSNQRLTRYADWFMRGL
jgi:hypothetical protein